MSYCLEEVFEMACQIERNGAEFYRQAAGQAPDDKSRQVLEELAYWEKKHEEIFDRMRKDIPEQVRTAYVDPEDEAALYLDSIVAGKVFPLDGPAEAPGTAEEVFEAAIAKEKDSIAFYTGLREAVPGGREGVEEIIAEEMKHVRILSDLLDERRRKGQ